MSGHPVPTCSSSKSKSEVVVPGSRIAEGQQYLGWCIQTEREKGLNKKTQNVWRRFSEMEEEFFEYKMTLLLASSDSDIINQSLSDKMQNLLMGFRRSLLVLSREVTEGEEKGKLVVVVGAGVIFAGQLGARLHRETVKLIRSTILLWLAKFVAGCKSEAVLAVCTLWREAEKAAGKHARDLYEEQFARREDLLFINIEGVQIPTEALECFSATINGGEFGQAKLWLRTRKRSHAGLQKERARNTKRKEDGDKLISIVAGIKYTCLLENNMIVSLLSVYDQIKWLEDKEKVMARAWASIEVWPFISFDDEGHGIYFQVGFFGAAGWNCLVFGPAFFPKEMMELLESPRTIVTGKNIHDDLSWILGSQAGWRAVDLGVWTRDLKFHGHKENGLKKMFEETLGFKKSKIDKNHPENRMKFGYIRSGNWAREKLDSRQLTYMAADVTLPGTVVFNILITLIMELGVATLDKHFQSLEAFVAPYVTRVIDRRFNEKLQHPSHSIPIDSRSLSENVAALALSEEIYYEDEVKDELAEERRERYEKEIIRLGQEKLVKGMSGGGPVWSKPPETRGKRGRDLAEKQEVEELV